MNSEPEKTPRPYTPTPADELLARVKRRSARARRHRMLGGGGSLTVVVALILVGILVPSTSARSQPSSKKPAPIVVSERIGSAYELSAHEPSASPAPASVVAAVENAEIGFSLELLNDLASATDTDDSNNVLVSPSSLATALAMLELGASGSTEQGIAAALQTAALSASEQAAGWHGLATLLGTETSTTGTNLKHEPELNIANALFLQEHFNVLPSFIRGLSSEFQTGLWEVDFANDLAAATNAINQWTSENTKGLIPQLFSPGALTPTTVLVLADAVYFHAEWARKFQSATSDRPFYLATGSTETVPFMTSGPDNSSKLLTVPVSASAKYTAVELPYAGKKLSALVVMPSASSLSGFVASLTPSALAQIVSGLLPQGIQLLMPTFTERSDYQLNQILSSMGMSQAFEQANFTNIASEPPLAVHAVEQHAYLQVTPQGTTAAAATGIGVVATATRAGEPRVVVIDHPFLFLIRDNATGAILFASLVENPSS